MALSPKPYLREISLKPGPLPTPSEYPFNIPAIKHLGRLTFHPDITFLVGENGTGKSTLLEAIAIAVGLNPEGGTRNFNFATRASHSALHSCLRIVRSFQRPRDSFFLRAESFFNLATNIEELDRDGGGPPIINSYGGRSLHEQSHGESFFALIMHRFAGRGLYILDEPEAALSPQRQILLLRRFRQLIHQDSQFIIATHSPILLAFPNARILVLDQNGYRSTRYEDTDHYRTTRDFLNHPEESIRRAFDQVQPGSPDASNE